MSLGLLGSDACGTGYVAKKAAPVEKREGEERSAPLGSNAEQRDGKRMRAI